MKSKTLIEKQLKRKNNSELVETIIAAKKKKAWLPIAAILSGSRKKQANINLQKINKEAKQGESVVVPGKVLSQGDIDKKVRVVALAFSDRAKEKLIKAGGEVSDIVKEIKSNPEAKGIKILK